MNAQDDFRIDRMIPTGKYRLLPLLEDVPTYRADYRTAHAIFQPLPGEIRIAFVTRKTRGDFAGLMNRLVADVNCATVRFVAVPDPDEDELLAAARYGVTPDDARPIYDAVYGFDFEEIDEYTTIDGESAACLTLIGEWKPDNRPFDQ